MISPGKEALGDLANVVLHESAHATFFVPNQSTLNESVAQFIGDGLAPEYLRETRGAESEEAVAYADAEARGAKRKALMRAAYKELDALYESKASDDEKRAKKREILARLQADTGIRRAINNATLIQYRTYDSGGEAMSALLAKCDGDWPRFVRRMKTLETVPHAKGQVADVTELVRPLVAGGCPK